MDFVKTTIIDRETVITKELLDSFQDGIIEAITKAEAALDITPANGALLETITQEKVDKWDSAQPNVIEKIFVNGAELPVDEKAVSILIQIGRAHV